MKSEANLVVSEIFGPTVQGEGPHLGKRCMFLRLMGCNLHCVWCDTPYTWRFTETYPHELGKVFDPKVEGKRMLPEEILERIRIEETGHLVISGGEPMLQARKLRGIISSLRYAGWVVEIETAGTIWHPLLSEFLVHCNVSPKLSHSGNSAEEAIRPDVLTKFVEYWERSRQVAFKFVVQQLSDFEELDYLVSNIGIPPEAVWIMPEGRSLNEISEIVQDVAETAVGKGYNLTTRLHVQVWGDKRGV
jgi:7-carboxy-7-deazaguanine synthase